MSRFAVSIKALADLKKIGQYTETEKSWGREQRNSYLGMINSCFQQLALNPDKGKDCGYVRKGYRKYIVGRHIIFYRMAGSNSIEIIRVLHGRMDMGKELI
ncbi:MAG: type II toxin-antitoxin system RelE/ParE family toxin [Dissulfurispiraceae bacterium]|jgi:toxin ParE1/3/4|nr:type II toxin-antitoxin system RelE/ParE family toxin [Dissulfurispiraceae bacterium]